LRIVYGEEVSGMRTDTWIDLIAVVVIALVGLLTAYVCFGLLQSEATGEFQQYSVGGAIAGALASASLLSTTYLQIRKSSGELQKLRENNQALQQKIIRGAPRPTGFDTEVSERQRIVLARPKDWKPRGGIIFEYELPQTEARKYDEFRARFRCSYSMISKDDEAQQQLSENGPKEWRSSSDSEALRRCYERVRQNTLNDTCVQSHTSEFVYLGEESQAIKCLKIIAHEYVGIHVQKDPLSGKEATYWNPISRDVYEHLTNNSRAGVLGRPVMPSHSGQEERLDRSGNDLANNDTAPAQTAVKDRVEITDRPQTSSVAGNEEEPGQEQFHQKDGTVLPPRQVRPAKIMHMSVICFHQDLETIFYFDFWDDEDDFVESSTVFNQILASTRLLT
jgi:hypothetical protein